MVPYIHHLPDDDAGRVTNFISSAHLDEMAANQQACVTQLVVGFVGGLFCDNTYRI
jgi:hypothetical protein